MLSFFTLRRAPVARGGRRTILGLEALDGRDQPSSLIPSADPGGLSSAAFTAQGMVANEEPRIVEFTCEVVGSGLIQFTGRVIDENPGGLTVTFQSGIPEIDGRTVVTASDGTFSISVRLPENGLNYGTVTVTTTDAEGHISNIAMTDVP